MLYVLIYSTGCSTGYRECVGVYSTKRGAIIAKNRDIRSPLHPLRREDEYSIEEVELDVDINVMYDEW